MPFSTSIPSKQLAVLRASAVAGGQPIKENDPDKTLIRAAADLLKAGLVEATSTSKGAGIRITAAGTAELARLDALTGPAPATT
jgi:predicted secreted protein